MDFYINEENCFERLLSEYRKYGTLIVALDFDGTIFDFHDEGLRFDDVVSLIKDCNSLGMKVVVFTANDDYDLVQRRCNSLEIKIEGINKQLLPQFEGRGKLYYNILLDDRAGLASAYEVLKKLSNYLKPTNRNQKILNFKDFDYGINYFNESVMYLHYMSGYDVNNNDFMVYKDKKYVISEKSLFEGSNDDGIDCWAYVVREVKDDKN